MPLNNNEKSAYQQNVAAPVQQNAPAQPTRREVLGQIYKIAETDQAEANRLYGLYKQSAQNPASPAHNQYSAPTNQAVRELSAYGIDASRMNTDWFNRNTDWQQHLLYNGTTNTPSKPPKRGSTPEQWKAYWTYQIFKSNQDTDDAEREWAGLQQELAWKAVNPGRNDSDDEIIGGIDWKKYPTLARMQETAGVNPVELNRGINFSKDDMYGTIWAARNGYSGGDDEYAVAMSGLGEGNVWQENPALRAKLDWNNRDTYSPYSAGMTLGDDVGMYFNMTSFDADDIERLRQTVDPNDETSVQMFRRVQSAFDNTQKAEDELAALEKKIDIWTSGDLKKDKVLANVERFIEKNCPTLKAMDDSIQDGSKLVETTKAINYKKQELLSDVERFCDARKTKQTGEQYVVEAGQDSMPVDTVSGAAPSANPVPAYSEQEQAVIAQKNAVLADAADVVEESGTPVEKTVAKNSWTAVFDNMKNALKGIRDGYSGAYSRLTQQSIRKSIGATAEATLSGADTIAAFDRNAERLNAVNGRMEEIEKSLGDLIYAGKNVDSYNRGTMDITVDGLPMTASIEYNDRTGQYELKNLLWENGDFVSMKDPARETAIEEVNKRLPGIADMRQKIVAASGAAMSDEELAMLDEYNKLSEERNTLSQYVKENEAAYNEAQQKTKDAEALRTATINMLTKAGVKPEELKVFEETGAVIDVLNGFTKYDPTQWEAFNAYDLYAQEIAFSGAGGYGKVLAAAKEGDEQNRKELETALWVLDYSERIGITLPDNVKNNLNRYVAKLERDHKDYEYFALLSNGDFNEQAKRGREMTDTEWDWSAWDGNIENQPGWDLLSDEQKDQLLGMVDTFDPNDIETQFNSMLGQTVESRMLGGFYAKNLMSDYEIDTYYYLLATEGRDAAEQYFDHLSDGSYGALTVRSKEVLQAGAAELADQGFWGRRGADVMSMILAPAAALGSLAYDIEYGINKATGKDVEYNPNNYWLSFNQFRTSARSEIQAEITRTYGEGSVLQKAFSSIQEIISNRGDSMMNMMAFGWLTGGMSSEMAQEFVGALPMAMGAAADVMAEAKERGASDTQAWILGSVALMCEAGTEAISIDNISKAFRIGQDIEAGTVKEFLKEWVTRSGWSEAFGESLNDAIENFADENVMGELSEHARRVAELKEANKDLTDAEADAMARQEEFASIMHTALVSFLSPGTDVIPLAAGRANYYRAQTKFAQRSGANVNIFDVMRADKAIRERVNATAESLVEAPETETAETTETAGTAEAVAPQEEASEEDAGTAVSEEERKQTEAQQIAADYMLLDKAKDADDKSKTATLAAVLDIEGTDASGDISKSVAVKLNDFLQDTFGGSAQDAVEWVQDLLLGASEGEVNVSELKQAITNMVLGGMESAAYQELYNSKVGGLTEEFVTAELHHQAQRLAATVAQDSANAVLQQNIANAVYETRVAEAEGRIIADGGTSAPGANEIGNKLAMVQRLQKAADAANRTLLRAGKDYQARQKTQQASAEAVQNATTDFNNDPSEENKKILIDALSKHHNNVVVTQEYEQALQKAREKVQTTDADVMDARDDMMNTLRQQAEQMVAQEDQRRAEEDEQERIAQEQAAQEAAAVQEEADRLSGKAEEDRQNAAIEQAVANENLEADEAEARTEALKERRDAIVESKVDLNGKVTNAEGMLAIRAFERKTGISVQFADLPENVRGKYQNGVVYLNQNRVKSGKTLVGQALVEASLHEITHAMENTNSYQNYRNVINDILFGDSNANYDNNAKYRAAIDAKISEYRNAVGQELSREDAEKEIIADFARLNLANKDTVQRFMDAGMGGKMRNVLHNINQLLKNYFKRLTGEDRQIAENLRKAERAFQKALNEVARTATHPEAEQFSVMQFAQSAGLTFNDQTLQLFDKDGNEIDGVKNKVTTEMINKTPVGMLIDSGLTGKQNADAKEMMVGLMNMVARYKDSNLVWEIGATTLSSTFSALKSNSDPQYKTTVDFGTVCAKTQAIIDTMSQVMLDRVKAGKNGGLTRKDIMKVYNAVNKAGLSVPCPVCYVFSRWMGVPSLLGQMSQYQHDFVVTGKDGKIDKAATQKKVDAYLKNAQDTYGDAKAINNQKTKLQNKRSALEEKRVELDVQSRDTKLTKEQRKEIKHQLDDVLDQMVDLDKQIGEVSAYNWITQALCKKDKSTGKFVIDDKFRVTPDEVLFDLNRTGEFAKDEKNWKYRNTRGAGMGKAIMPYSGETIGDILYGVKAQGRQIKNPWLNMDEKKAVRQLKDAQKRAKQQNLVGGQRLQSTSDFRPEWGLDYIMSFLELQAAKSKVQMYTKVAEAVDFFASVGADVNLSIMGKGTGWHEATAEELASMTEEQKEQATVNGKVYVMDFSDVTGMKYSTARDLKNKYDNVQMILVGMNDTHIRLALKNSDIDFVIPWHSSGNSKDVLAGLIKSVGEKLDSSVDYTTTQTDMVKGTSKKYTDENGNKLEYTAPGERTEEQKALWDARVKLLTKGDKELTQTDREVLLSNPITKELYRRFTEQGYDDECFGVKLTKDQANQIFPYEYWDTSSTKETADINGQRFVEYCEAMGIVPRFSQFKDDPGYWKLLIDRPMYNNDGSYHQQQIIDVTNAKIGNLNEEGQLTDSDIPTKAQAKYAPKDPRSENYNEYTEAQKNAIEYAEAALDEKYDDGTEGQYSVYGNEMTEADMELLDEDYMSAVESGDTETAQKMVDEAAEQAGYDTPRLYHGTRSFGFTEFNLEKGENLIFATHDRKVGETYSGETNRSRISEASTLDVDSLNGEQLIEEAKKNLHKYREYRLMTQEEKENAANDARNDISVVWQEFFDFIKDHNGAFDEYKQGIVDKIMDALTNVIEAENDDVLYENWGLFDRLKRDFKFADESLFNEFYRGEDRNKRLYNAQRRLADFMYEGNIYNDAFNDYVFDNQIALELNAELHKGVYELYGKTGKQLVIDANGNNWNQIIPPAELDLYGPQRTRDIAEAAKYKGYDSVLIKNLKDNGGETPYNWPSDVYIFFDANQVKSADTVTYDKNGKVIHLSERFNLNNPDIRYSAEGEMTDADRDIDRVLVESGVLTQEQINKMNKTDVGEGTRQWGTHMAQDMDELADQAKEYVLNHSSYQQDTNKEQIERAVEWFKKRTERLQKKYEESGETKDKAAIMSEVYTSALQQITDKKFNFRSADGQARMAVMMGMAIARDDTYGQVQIANQVNRQGTALGQALQSRKLFRLMTPQGRIATLTKMLDEQQQELYAKGKNVELKFSDWLIRAAGAAENEGEMDLVRAAAINELAEQVPANFADRVRNLRMLSMLANPRTHIRNFIGNAFFVPFVSLKNKFGAFGEIITGQEERTKTLAIASHKDIRAFAREQANKIRDVLTGEAKFTEATQLKKAQGKLGAFMDGLSDVNSRFLEGEDWFFLKGHFRRVFGGWMTANGYTVEQVKNDASLLAKGRQYAVDEAQKATYRDFNEAAAKLNALSRDSETIWGKGLGFVTDAVLPFKKTPANILRRGLEYSPLGIAKSVYSYFGPLHRYNQALQDLESGKITEMPKNVKSPNQVIDEFCSGLSGSMIMGLGFLLAGTGAVTCGMDDDEDKFEKAKGRQKYSIKLFDMDVTYTMDWAAPMSMPFFVGAAIRNELESKGDFNFEKAFNAVTSISEPIFNLSMLDGLNSVFKTSQYDDTNELTQIGAKILSNYLSSYVPSALGAVNRALVDDKSRKAFVKSGEGTGVAGTFRYAWEQFENKIPGLSQTNIPVRDIWGRVKTEDLARRIFENIISPGYVEDYRDDPIINEMARLYTVTNNPDMIPKEDPEKSFSSKNVKYVYDAEQWDKLKEVRNGTAFEMLTELINSDSYKDDTTTDAARAEMISRVWDYANQVGRKAVFPEYQMDNLGEDAIGTIANESKVSVYQTDMLHYLDDGDLTSYNNMVEAIRFEMGDDKTADAKIKEKIGNSYRDKYKAAYRKNDDDEMDRIKNILDDSGFSFKISDWEKAVDKEE